MGLKTYKTVPVPAPIWLQTALGPVIQACKFEVPPPVELRPTGRWRGWCAGLTEAPDGRVVVSSRAQFWRKNEVVEVFLHEVAHRLIPYGLHDPAFLCMYLCLLLRADSAGLGDHVLLVNAAGFYDVQDLPSQLFDEPDQGLARSIQWSVLTARELVQNHPQMSAEGLAIEVMRRFDLWLLDVAAEPEKRAQRLRQVARQKEILVRLREQIWTLKLVAGGLGLLVVAMFLVLK